MGWMRRVAQGVGALIGLGVLGIAGYAGWAFATVDSRLNFPDTPAPALAASTDPAVIERGRYLVYGPAHCSQCHGDYPRENPAANVMDVPLSGGFEFAMGPIGTTYSANLTSDPETGIGRRTDAQIARTVRTGVLSTGEISLMMRYSAAILSDDDLVAVISFLRSTAPIKNEVPPGVWGPVGKLFLPLLSLAPRTDTPPAGVQAGDEPSVARGEYLANSAMYCVACHTQYDPMTFESVGTKFAGGTAEGSHGPDSDKEFAPPNLTPDPETGITGKLTEDQFVERFRAGRVYASSIMPWENFARTSESDLRSVYRYLRTLPPTKNDVGPSYRDVGWTPDGG